MNIEAFAEVNGVRRNERGGYYVEGKAFTEAQWVVIVEAYTNQRAYDTTTSLYIQPLQ